jgi:Kef-type K+ transport system membrane component KefB
MTATMADTAYVLLDLALMVAVGSCLGAIAVRWGQPAVIGEILAGIALGPTLLGLLPGHLSTRLFPVPDRPFLTVLANVGLVMFMFGVGFELDHRHMRQVWSSSSAVSLGSVALPFLLGIAVAPLLYPANRSVHGHDVGRTSFLLFLGVAMSITAFPVLARIITGLELHHKRLGTFAMACAAGADVIAWAALAIVVAVVEGHGRLNAVRLVGEMLAFTLVLAFVVSPLLRRVLASGLGRRPGSRLPFILIVTGLLISAWVTTRLGFQPIFGGFAFGAVMPKKAVMSAAPEVPLLIEKVAQLLVPIFFITTGLSVNLTGIGGQGLLELLVVLCAACTGKFIGSAVMARLLGFDSRRAAAIGVLMNSRGLTELVVIQVGASLGILTQRLYAVMIIMAIVTTVATAPLFRRVYNDRLQREDGGQSLLAEEASQPGEEASQPPETVAPERATRENAPDPAR